MIASVSTNLLYSIIWLAFSFNMILFLAGFLSYLRVNRQSGHNDPEKFIIQICTAGRAPKTVRQTLETIRDYNLCFAYETWVVIEEYDKNNYAADRIIRVPKNFETPNKTKFKARALEYAREVRIAEGIEDRATKIIYLDDDSIPDKEYFEYAFHSRFDVGHGLVSTSRHYGRNLLISIADNLRVADCVGTCATFCRIGHPMVVHGEGLVVRGNVEKAISWDFGPSLAEDLLFGLTAAKKFKYGFIPFFTRVSSPFTFRDFFMQRRRWYKGILQNIPRVDAKEKAFLLTRFMIGLTGVPSVSLALFGLFTNIQFNPILEIIFVINSLGLMSLYMVGAWINTRKVKELFKTLAIFYVSAVAESFVIVWSILSRTRIRFEVIQKE